MNLKQNSIFDTKKLSHVQYKCGENLLVAKTYFKFNESQDFE